MLNLDWITEDEYKEAHKQALAICTDFFNDTNEGEQLWTEIEVSNKFFDIECYEEDAPEYDWDDFDKRQNPVHCNLYGVSRHNEYRVTDWDKSIRLFTMKER